MAGSAKAGGSSSDADGVGEDVAMADADVASSEAPEAPANLSQALIRRLDHGSFVRVPQEDQDDIFVYQRVSQQVDTFTMRKRPLGVPIGVSHPIEEHRWEQYGIIPGHGVRR